MDFLVKRTLGIGDTLFAINACRALKESNPAVRIWFAGKEEWNDWLAWVPFLEEGPPPSSVRLVDMDTASTAGGRTRYRIMADMLGVDTNHLTIPWNIPDTVIQQVKNRWPGIENGIVFSPWCGGLAPTRSLTEEAVRYVLDNAKHPVYLNHHVPIPPFEEWPLNTYQITVAEFIAVTAVCHSVIAIDSMPLHLAVSMGKKTVGVFTHIDPMDRLSPQDSVVLVTPSKDLKCVPCGDFVWPYHDCHKYGYEVGACAKSIRPEELLAYDE